MTLRHLIVLGVVEGLTDASANLGGCAGEFRVLRRVDQSPMTFAGAASNVRRKTRRAQRPWSANVWRGILPRRDALGRRFKSTTGLSRSSTCNVRGAMRPDLLQKNVAFGAGDRPGCGILGAGVSAALTSLRASRPRNTGGDTASDPLTQSKNGHMLGNPSKIQVYVDG